MTDPMARRTCVVCRGEEDRAALIRLVADPDGNVVVDLRARLPGRGAWLHPRVECVAAAEREPRRLTAAFKGGPVRTAGLSEQLRSALLHQVVDGLSLAARAGALVGGADVVRQGIVEGRVQDLIFARDASDRTVQEMLRSTGEHVVVTVLPVDKDELGARVGQPPRAVVGIVSAPAFRHLREQLRRLRSLGYASSPAERGDRPG